MSIQFTDQQKAAIGGRGNALLVSAAAGSGKTAVLVERILRYLTEQEGDIQRLIIMTYTSAAAAEMLQKLKKAVDGYLKEQGGDDRLMRQSALLDSAEIGTVHSICLGLITRYFDRLELDPRCRLLDETAAEAMIAEEAEVFLEELTGREEPEVQKLLACYASGRDDEGLKELLIKGMKFLDDQPLPKDYIRRTLEPYRNMEAGIFACFPEDGLRRFMVHTTQELIARYDHMLGRIRRHFYLRQFPDLLEFLEAERETVAAYLPLVSEAPYDEVVGRLKNHRFATLNWNKLVEKDGSPAAKELLESERKSFKDAFTAYKKKFALTEGEELARIAMEGALLEVYLSACLELGERLAARRRRGGYISYHDMEQMALRLLVQDYDPLTDTLTPTPLALELREDYDEIIIDEFQDTNRTQDLIFRALSQNGSNLFMVGDLKQSIYRFRGAEPEIFDQKRQQSEPYQRAELTAPTVLELNVNFRSHPGVLNFANRVFGSIMSPALGGVVYDERERLVPGRVFKEPEAVRAELHYLQPEEAEPGKRQDLFRQNARYAARYIAKAVQEKQTLLLPDGGERPVEYRDFAILLRNTTGAAGTFERELLALGIPVVNSNKGVRFFELPEVQSILSYLLVLNNPYNDVALVSLLYGDHFRFSVGELAGMRHRKSPLFNDLKKAAETDAKAKKALETIEGYRALAETVSVYELLYRIYQESPVFASYAAEEGGAEKRANLELLAEDARLFEADGYRGLYAFVEHIRISSSGSQGGARLRADENSVRIMSIHKSKGLEFPICILGDCHKGFNRKDTQARILLHPRYGGAVEYAEPALYFRCRSLSQFVLADQMLNDSIGEEERVLYVALTRPISKTVMLINVESERMEKWITEGASCGEILPNWLLKGSGACFGRWVTALLGGSAEGEALRSRCGLPEGDYPPLLAEWQMAEEQQIEAEEQAASTEEFAFDAAAFHARLDWVYPHLSAVRLPAKLSVSELKGLREQDADAEPLFEEQVRMAVPRFTSNFAPRGNEVGNALHQALQFSDFERLAKEPEEELARLVHERFILESQRKLIPLEKIRRFTQSECFKNLLSSERYSKEERFLFPIPAKELFGETAEGEILIQGVLDCYSINGNEAVILDYKTDRVSSEQELIDRYRVQMDLYAEALKRVKGLKVIRKEIYSFSLEKTILL